MYGGSRCRDRGELHSRVGLMLRQGKRGCWCHLAEEERGFVAVAGVLNIVEEMIQKSTRLLLVHTNDLRE